MEQTANVIPFPGGDVARTMRVARFPLRSGDAGIARTVLFMRGLVNGREGACNPYVRSLALNVTKDVPNRDFNGLINALFSWVKNNIKFRGEFKETIQSPLLTLQLAAGDCDDHAALLAALLAALGLRSRFKTVATSGHDFTHVYAVAIQPGTGKEIALDTTVDRSYPGWEPETQSRARSWRPMGDAAADSLQTQTYKLDPNTKTARVLDAAQPILDALAARIGGPGYQGGSVSYNGRYGRASANLAGAGGGVSSTALIFGAIAILGVGIFALGGRR